MIIQLDQKPDFVHTQTLGERTFYALAEPRIILRCDGFTLADLAIGEYCDASIGWDEGDHTEFVLAGNEHKRHTKITLRKRLGLNLNEFRIDEKLKPLSAILATAPRAAARFDAEKIAAETISLLTDHISRLSHRLSIGGWHPGVKPESDFVPLRAEIDLLCRAANGEIDRADASAETIGEIQELIQDIAELTSPYWTAFYTIPADWRETDLGRAWDAARYWLMSADMISLADAARLLYDAADAADLNKLDRLVQRGDLTEYIDPTESNPRRARRILKSDVQHLLAKRTR